MANPKVTINQTEQTPSQQLVAQAKAEVSTTDGRGRVIKLQKPSPLAKLRFFEAMGESSSNPLWGNTVAPLMYVAAIDGEPVPTPITKLQIEALYQRLDDDGMEAIGEALPGNFGLGKSEVDENAVKK